jgi:hypothetical protein
MSKLKDPQITLEAVRRRIERYNIRIIYYAAQTCWWTISAQDLYKHPKSGLPCDPRGGMLLECHDPIDFLDQAEKNPG